MVTERHATPGEQAERLSTGIPTLDAAIGGGLTAGSTTSLLGAPGVGKTLLGLSFLHAGAANDEPGLYFGFYEAPQRLLAKARGVGRALDDACQRGLLHIQWHAPLELFVDEIAEEIDALVTRHGIRRLFLDGIEGFAESAMHPERVPRFVTALTVLLRARGVTTVLSEELPLYADAVESSALSVSALVENIILMRYYEHAAEIRRLISVVKLRESDFDPAIRELQISSAGLTIGERLAGLRHLMIGRPTGSRPPSARGEPRS